MILEVADMFGQSIAYDKLLTNTHHYTTEETNNKKPQKDKYYIQQPDRCFNQF